MSSADMTRNLAALGISRNIIAARNLVACNEAAELQLAESGDDGREHYLTPATTKAWQKMKDAARAEGESIFIASGYRSIARQTEIIQGKLDAGIPINEILLVLAPPGYSEHHTGRAIDISTDGVEAMTEEFEDTSAFAWLEANAQRFAFTMSYPRGNACGYLYEPWHWCFAG